MSGQARYLEQSADWWTKRVYPNHHERMHVDYYFHLWDDGTDNLDDRIKNLYNTDVVEISDYASTLEDHIGKIKHGNTNANDWHLVPEYVQHTVCYKADHVSDYMYNFPGMYLASAKIAKTFEPYHKNYDIAIKTRTDCVLNPMAEQHWQNLFGNMLNQKAFSDTIFTPWLRIRNGMPFFGDLAFVGRSKLMYKFLENMDKNLVKIATDDKHLMSDFLIDPEIPFAHWLWSRLSIYSRTDWLAISVVWPVPFGTCLFRREEEVLDKSYQYLEQTYNEEEARRHEKLFHSVGDTKD